MNISTIMEEKHIRKSELSKRSSVPYSTICDIVSGKTEIEKCSAATVYKIAKALDVSMEKLLAPHCEKRPEFEWFKSEMSHELKRKGDRKFLIEILKSGIIFEFYDREWYREAFYLLAMVDYLSRVHNIPWCQEFEQMRSQRLDPPIYPADVYLNISVSGNEEGFKKEARDGAIPEFLRHGIIEGDIRDAV